jgi:uncharacterized membrane protein
MYLLDPDQGNARCERIRDGLRSAVGSAKEEAAKVVRDFPPAGTAIVCGGLLLAGAARRGLVGGVLVATGAAGLVSLVRSAGQPSTRRPASGSTIRIDAPVERVFEFFMNPENFSRVIARVKDIKNVGQGVSHWTLDEEPHSVQWESSLTRVIPNERIEWHSTPGSSVESFGVVSCEPRNEGTLLHVSAVARWPSGAEDELVDDLHHVKDLIEEEIVQPKT